jgi:hypothetical protein
MVKKNEINIKQENNFDDIICEVAWWIKKLY